MPSASGFTNARRIAAESKNTKAMYPGGVAQTTPHLQAACGLRTSYQYLNYIEPCILPPLKPQPIVKGFVSTLTMSNSNSGPRGVTVNYTMTDSKAVSTWPITVYRTATNSPSGGAFVSSGVGSTGYTVTSMYPYYNYYASVQADELYTSTNVATTSTPFGYRFAGSFTLGFSGDGGLARSAALRNPAGVVFNASKTIMYIADSNNHRVRAVDMATNIITTVIGTGNSGTGANDNSQMFISTLGNSANFAFPTRVGYDDPFLFIVNAGIHVRAFNTGSVAATTSGVSVDPGCVRTISSVPSGNVFGVSSVADTSGNMYVANNASPGQRIYRINKSNSTPTIVAGINATGYSPDGTLATSALLKVPTGCDLDRNRNVLYISDRDNFIVRAVNLNTSGTVTVANVPIAAGTISTVAGILNQSSSSTTPTDGDGGPATSARLSGGSVWTISVDPLGNIYIGDGNLLRRVSVDTGIITTIAGTSGNTTDGTNAYTWTCANAMQSAFGPDNSIYTSSFGGNYVIRVS